MAAMLAGAVAFTAGWQVRAWKAGADKVEQMRADDRTAIHRAERGDSAAAAHEAAKADMRRQDQILTGEVERVVEKAVYRDVCIDADGLRIIAAALDGADADPGQPAPAVPDSRPPD